MKKIFKWLDNFWYHYKWRTIIITFFAVIFIIGFVQCMQKTDADVSILYVGPEVVSGEEYYEMEKVLAGRLDKDYNDDGEHTVQITDLVYLSDEQLEKKKAEAAADGEALYYDTSLRGKTLDQARNWIVSGAMMICIFDPAVYEQFSAQKDKLFVPLSSYLDEIPEYAYDEYSVRFSEIPYVKFSGAFAPIAENTVLCVVNLTAVASWGPDDAKARLDTHTALVKRLIEFSLD